MTAAGPVPVVLDFIVRQGAFTLDIRERFDARAVALFGPSGAGKTTVVDAIAGLRQPARGTIAIGERSLFDSDRRVSVPPRQRRVGYVPQDIALFPHLGVRDNILYGAPRDGPLALERVLDTLEIAPLADRAVPGLSGGERQRVAIARALMSSPDLLLLDEPLAAVDLALRARILPSIEKIRDEFGIPLIYVSHAADEVRRVADWVIVLDAGRVVATGAPEVTLRDQGSAIPVRP